MYTFTKTSRFSLEILDPASSCDPVTALETRYVFSGEVWHGLGNYPKLALEALDGVSPFSQTRSRWSRALRMTGIIFSCFYSIFLPQSSIPNWDGVSGAFFSVVEGRFSKIRQ